MVGEGNGIDEREALLGRGAAVAGGAALDGEGACRLRDSVFAVVILNFRRSVAYGWIVRQSLTYVVVGDAVPVGGERRDGDRNWNGEGGDDELRLVVVVRDCVRG